MNALPDIATPTWFAEVKRGDATIPIHVRGDRHSDILPFPELRRERRRAAVGGPSVHRGGRPDARPADGAEEVRVEPGAVSATFRCIRPVARPRRARRGRTIPRVRRRRTGISRATVRAAGTEHDEPLLRYFAAQVERRVQVFVLSLMMVIDLTTEAGMAAWREHSVDFVLAAVRPAPAAVDRAVPLSARPDLG